MSEDELDIVRSWRHLVTGRFYVFRELNKYTVFLSTTSPAIAYGVLALSQPFEELIGPSLPVLTQTALLPFKGMIVYDGLMSSYNISFGPGIRRNLNEDFKEAKARHGGCNCRDEALRLHQHPGVEEASSRFDDAGRADCAYDRLRLARIPRVKGKRREVRRMAQRSKELLARYRRGEPVCGEYPLKKALAKQLPEVARLNAEERHAFHPEPPSQFVRLLSSPTGQHSLGLAPVQTGLGNQVKERLPLAEVTTFNEVFPEQCLHTRILAALLLGQPDEPVASGPDAHPLRWTLWAQVANESLAAMSCKWCRTAVGWVPSILMRKSESRKQAGFCQRPVADRVSGQAMRTRI